MLEYKILEKDYSSLLGLGELKNYLRLSQEEAQLEALISCAIDAAESFLRFALVKQTVAFKAKLLHKSQVRLPIRYFSELKRMELVNAKEGQRVPQAGNYDINSNVLEILFCPFWPVNLEIEYIASYPHSKGPPFDIKQGLLKHISNIYDKGQLALSDEVLSLYHPYRVALI